MVGGMNNRRRINRSDFGRTGLLLQKWSDPTDHCFATYQPHVMEIFSVFEALRESPSTAQMVDPL